MHKTSKERLKKWLLNLKKSPLITLWCLNRNFNALTFGWTSMFFFFNLNTTFCNLTGKVLNLKSCYLTCFKFDAALFNLYIYKSAKIFSFLRQYLTFWYSDIFCKIHVYLGIVMLRKWRTYNKNFKWKQHVKCTICMISYQVITW